MSDQAYGTQSGGGQEGGTSNASDQEISAQEDSQSEGQELQSNERYITKEELEARIGEVMRSAQSMTDKMGSRLDKEIQSALKQANDSIELTKQAGIKYTPEQEQAIRDRAINSAYTRLNQSQESPPPVSGQPKARPQQEQGGQQVNPGVWINQEVARIMRDTGVYIPPEEANELIVGENKDMTPYQ